MRHLLEVKIFWNNESVWMLRAFNFFFFKENSVMPATNITIDLLRMEEEMEEHLSAVFHLVLGLA